MNLINVKVELIFKLEEIIFVEFILFIFVLSNIENNLVELGKVDNLIDLDIEDLLEINKIIVLDLNLLDDILKIKDIL